MKVLDIYSVNDLDKLIVDGKSVNDIMNSFFSKYPSYYRENYDINLKDLMIWRIDEDYEGTETSEYHPFHNLITYENIDMIIHEFMHMASFNKNEGKLAIVKDINNIFLEYGMVEGMTEYLACLATGKNPKNYFFEYFVISMLSKIDGLFETFFVPNYDKFISLFKDKRDIYSLMYALEYYHDNVLEVDFDSEFDVIKLTNSFRSVIDKLIDIELSFDESFFDRREYADKFMVSISSSDIKLYMEDIDPKYKDYAYKQVKTRILRRK